MKTSPRRIGQKVGILLTVGFIALVAYDLSHIYRAKKLLVKSAGGDVATAKSHVDQLARDMVILQKCKAPKDGQPTGPFTECVTGLLPTLQTGVGMLAGDTLALAWLTRHPDDKAVYTAASATMDRLWDHYRQVDMPSFQLMDEAAESMNESVLYRVFEGTAPENTDAYWRNHLKLIEMALNEPELAKKQALRDLSLAEAAAPDQAKSAGQTKSN